MREHSLPYSIHVGTYVLQFLKMYSSTKQYNRRLQPVENDPFSRSRTAARSRPLTPLASWHPRTQTFLLTMLKRRRRCNGCLIINHLLQSLRTVLLLPTKKNMIDRRLLSDSFQPGPFTVICAAKGQSAKKSPGNQWFRKVVESHLDQYEKASCKLDKSLIVSMVMDTVREANPISGGFVKQTDDGSWNCITESAAREKVGACFRDCLHTVYKSSTKAKILRRRQVKQFQKLVTCTADDGTTGMDPETLRIQDMFDRANCNLLALIKVQQHQSILCEESEDAEVSMQLEQRPEASAELQLMIDWAKL